MGGSQRVMSLTDCETVHTGGAELWQSGSILDLGIGRSLRNLRCLSVLRSGHHDCIECHPGVPVKPVALSALQFLP